jgi:hypothetical protein
MNNIEYHIIPQTFHYISVYFVFNSRSVRCCLSLHTPLPTLFTGFPVLTSPLFLVLLKFASELWLMVHGVVVYTFTLRYPPKEIIRQRDQVNVQAMEAHRAMK